MTGKEILEVFAPHENYETPNVETIDRRFEEIGFTGSYYVEVVQTISNAFSHTYYGTSSTCAINKGLSPHQLALANFICNLDYHSLSGMTPLEKAANAIALLSDMLSGKNDGDASEGIALPIFTKSEECKKSAKKAIEFTAKLRQMATTNLIKEALEYDETMPPEANTSKLSKKQAILLENLSILGTKGKIKAKAELPKIKPQQMTEYGQASSLSNISAMVMPTYKYKLATKDLMVNKRINPNKQMLVFLIDVSGSMSHEDKQMWVQALLLNRLQSVVEGKAELLVVPFERDIYSGDISVFRNANDVYTSRGRKTNFYRFYPADGGPTNIERSVRSVHEGITKGKIGSIVLHGERPQVTIINDGDDKINPAFKAKYATNAFILGQDNRELKSVVLSSGGIYERFL
jgi:hypothetical protein